MIFLKGSIIWLGYISFILKLVPSDILDNLAWVYIVHIKTSTIRYPSYCPGFLLNVIELRLRNMMVLKTCSYHN